MVWESLYGHDRAIEQFRRAVRRGRLASTFLLVGPDGVGKRTFALKLAQSLLCERTPEAELGGCGVCPACQQVAALTHPDVRLVAKPADRSFIPIELFIGDREHRLREGLCHDIALKPFRGGRKVAIIDDADCLNQEGANCLLKTLEEPPPRSVLMLIGTSEQRQLPTIRSRCQIVRFLPLRAVTVDAGSYADVQIALRMPEVREGIVYDTELNAQLLDSHGRVAADHRRVVRLFSRDPFAGRRQWLGGLGLLLFDPGKETAKSFDSLDIPYKTAHDLSALQAVDAGIVVIGEGISLRKHGSLTDRKLLFRHRTEATEAKQGNVVGQGRMAGSGRRPPP
jgi:hypothetical protein